MSGLTLRNLTNAFVRLEVDDLVVLVDPWLTPGIYDGGWYNFPPVQDPEGALFGVTHVLVTHIHEDHFDLELLRKLDPNVPIYFPKKFPNHLMKRRLEELGFHCVEMTFGHAYALNEQLQVIAIPPMNASGLEFDSISEEALRTDLSVDAGFLVRYGDVKVVLLADNMPYRPEDAGSLLEEMRDCDLLAFGYNGAGSDYPLCYDLAFEEKEALSDAMELKRQQALDRFIALIRPKALMPYSSEFAVGGRCALEFARFYEGRVWLDKTEMAKRFQKAHGIPAYDVWEGDCLEWQGGEVRHFQGNRVFPSLGVVAEQLKERRPPWHEPVASREALEKAMEKAIANLFAKMEQHRLVSRQRLVLRIPDHGLTYVLDLQDRRQLADLRPGEPYVACSIDSGYLWAILTGVSNWNSAFLSFRLAWERVPNFFDMHLHTAFNFLTCLAPGVKAVARET